MSFFGSFLTNRLQKEKKINKFSQQNKM